jgi:hypothetical protein
MADVVRIADHLTEVGSDYRFNVDEVIEGTKGIGLENVLIVGEQADGTLVVRSACNAGEALVLMEKAKHRIVFGD